MCILAGRPNCFGELRCRFWMKNYDVDQTRNIDLRRKDEETLLGLGLKVIVSKVRGSQPFGGRWQSNRANFTLKAVMNVFVRDVLEHV